MEFYNSTTNLKELLKKILTSEASSLDIINFIQDINQQATFNSIESNLLVLEIYIVLTKSEYVNIPLINLSLETIPAKIIFSNSMENMATPKLSTAVPQNNNCCDQEQMSLKDKYNSLKEKWKFPPDQFPGLKYPPAGDTGNMFFVDDTVIPGKSFRCEAIIDHEGNIVCFPRDPVEILSEDSFDEIYAGLAKELFDFQSKA